MYTRGLEPSYPSSPADRSRVVVAGALLAIPMAGLVLLLARPNLDMAWEDHPSHFWLVLGVALINVGLGVATSGAARQRLDTRLFLVSLTLLTSAGFLALHALATPGVLLAGPNAGFVIATPVGLLLAAAFAAASSTDATRRLDRLVQRHQRGLLAGIGAIMVGWGIGSFAGLPVLANPLSFQEAPVVLRSLMPVGVILYLIAAVSYGRLYLGRRRALPLAVAVAFVLLAEAMVAVAFSRSWHASWWEWHLLMLASFGTITVAARVEYRRERSVTGTFGSLYLEQTLERVDRQYSSALSDLVSALNDDRPLAPMLDRLRAEGLSAEETALLEHSARELRRVDSLFRPYVGPRLAEKLIRDPDLFRLGGAEIEATVMFADLAGFTSFSEAVTPSEVVEMLNMYWGVVVPIVAGRQEGVIERFAGDAVLVVFNALGDQPDHAQRACRAAVEVRDETERLAAGHPGWPRFRIGVNTGPLVVGNVGTGAQRSFTAIGDTTNVAARLQASARPGQVVVASATRVRLPATAMVLHLGTASLKGKAEPVDRYELVRIDR